jgi:hypothetical protein
MAPAIAGSDIECRVPAAGTPGRKRVTSFGESFVADGLGACPRRQNQLATPGVRSHLTAGAIWRPSSAKMAHPADVGAWRIALITQRTARIAGRLAPRTAWRYARLPCAATRRASWPPPAMRRWGGVPSRHATSSPRWIARRIPGGATSTPARLPGPSSAFIEGCGRRPLGSPTGMPRRAPSGAPDNWTPTDQVCHPVRIPQGLRECTRVAVASGHDMTVYDAPSSLGERWSAQASPGLQPWGVVKLAERIADPA